ncbi:MAG TPA: hypothetical protein VNZ86_16535 [Bacteroidia bacterium]|jgi:hypothetical protein|nr:hypothetical protein [Bacteroidia bacterium]
MHRLITLILIGILLVPSPAQAQKDTSDNGMKFDLGISKARNLNLWPLLQVENEPGFKKIKIFFNLYNRTEIEESKATYTHLFPLYWYRREMGHTQSIRLLSLYYPSLYHYEASDEDSTRSHHFVELCPGLSLLSFTTSYSGSYKERNLFFLFRYKKDLKEEYTRFTFFPLIWNVRDKGTHHFVFFPLYALKTGANYTRYWITPFFVHKRDSAGSSNTLFPVYWNWKKYHSGLVEKHTVLFPFYFAGKTSLHSNHVFFPLVWSFQNTYYHSFTFVPLFSAGHSTDGNSSHFSIATLYWHFRNKYGESNILFPVWWQGRRSNSDDSSRYNVLFPLWWSFDDQLSSPLKRSTSRVLFPIVWKFNSPWYKTFTLFPIYSRGHSPDYSIRHIGITALYWHKITPTSSFTTLLPLWWQGTSSHTSTESTYGRSYRILFPVWWEGTTSGKYQWKHHHHADSTQSEYTSTTITHSSHHDLFPFWFSRTSAETCDTPRTSHWTHNKVFFPLYWSLQSDAGSQLAVLPLFDKGFTNDTLNHRTWFITPLTGKTSDSAGYSNWVLPFYFTSVTHTSTVHNILLFAWIKERTAESVSTSILWPIFQYTRYQHGSEFHLLPILWFTNKPEVKVKAVFPFFLVRRDSFSNARYILWPLYQRKEVKDTCVTTGILWKVLEFQHYTNGDASTRFLHLVYAHVHKKGYTVNSLFPFYYYSSEADGSFYHSWLLSFYNYRKQKVEGTAYYYQEQRIFWLLRLRSNYSWLKERGVKKKRSELR